MSVLVTGGAGYIGSHCVKILQDRKIPAICIDNLSKGHKKAVKETPLYLGNISDRGILDKVFSENKIDTVMHFAAFSVVPESEQNPYIYYKNNVGETLELLNSMAYYGVKRIVFSSTAATYGIPDNIPITESDIQKPISTYGETKLAIEHMLQSFDRTYGIKSVSLRYFNVAGAYHTGEIGEDHTPETHLIPIILQVSNKKRDKIQIYGKDYKTKDGTNIRDYIHIEDLIDAHIKAMEYLKAKNKTDCFNLGSSEGYSNLEILNAAKKVTDFDIPFEFAPRRAGDPDILIASSKKAETLLKWERKHPDIESIIASAWKWHKQNPNGYQ